MHNDDLAGIHDTLLSALFGLEYHQTELDMTKPGEQVPLFRACFWCGQYEHMPVLPYECSCGQVLRRLISIPEFRGPHWLVQIQAFLWIRKAYFTSRMLENPIFRFLWHQDQLKV